MLNQIINGYLLFIYVAILSILIEKYNLVVSYSISIKHLTCVIILKITNSKGKNVHPVHYWTFQCNRQRPNRHWRPFRPILARRTCRVSSLRPSGSFSTTFMPWARSFSSRLRSRTLTQSARSCPCLSEINMDMIRDLLVEAEFLT